MRPRGAPREVIDHSIGPVWEANHVWLIFIFVVLWTGFPEAYASITLTLFVPLALAAFGIVLRGSSFAFRKTVFRTRDRRNFGAAFALSSVLVPYCMGAIAGAIASGRVPAGGSPVTRGTAGSIRPRCSAASSPSSSVAYLAAVYLVWDARRLDDTRWPSTSGAGPSVLPSSPASRRGRHLRAPRRRPLRLRRARRHGRSRS